MNELQIFRNKEFGQIRTVTIGGEPWMIGKDVAVALGYSTGSRPKAFTASTAGCTRSGGTGPVGPTRATRAPGDKGVG